MRIVIDASPVLFRSAGVKNYLYHWVAHLRRHAGEHAVSAFPFLGEFGELNHERSVLGAWDTLSRLALVFFLNLPANPSLNLLASRADVFHVSNQLRRPIRSTRVTATLHDLTALTMPELHTSANIRADRNFYERIARRADGLIAVSENTRQDAVRLLGLRPEKIEVIHSGVADAFFDATPAPDRFGITQPYILYVGTLEPRKNLDALLDAYEQLRPSLRYEFALVVAGSSGWAATSTLRRLQSGITGVRYVGYVPERDLPTLTAGATVFAYPSLYEGFGFPVAQAMAAGVPVVTSNISALPEVAGDAALLVDPRSSAEICGALERLLLTPSLRDQLAASGIRRAQQFRWDRCARESIRFFEKIAGGWLRLRGWAQHPHSRPGNKLGRKVRKGSANISF